MRNEFEINCIDVIEYIKKTKKKIMIYGAGIVARATIISLKEILEDSDRIRCCVVTNLNHNPSSVEGIEVKTIDNVIPFKDDIVLIAVKGMYYQKVTETLNRYGINDCWSVSQDKCIEVLRAIWEVRNKNLSHKYIINEFDEGLSKEEYITFLSRQLNETVLNFEVNLADHCNLNCQSCNHFSPIAFPTFLDIDMYDKDIARLADVIEHKAGTIMLLGGEPLLYPMIEEAIEITRRGFGEAEISIVTNGLLLPKMSDEFWNKCNAYNVGLLITKYPLDFDYAKCEKKAEENSVRLTYTLDSVECKTTYKLPLSIEKKMNPYANYAKCYHANKCVVLKKGRLYTCPIGAYINHFNSYFDKNLPEEEMNSISIYSVNSLIEIEDFLKQPIEMCKHCKIADYIFDIPWSTSKRDISEWT